MAKSVLELAVGTGQWNAGLKKAKSALDNFTQSQGGLQQALAKDSENMRKFVQMMGQTESTAKTAKGQMNDYKSTIEQLTMQYNRMTDAQKKTIGQDYLNSIDQLKQKYQSVNEEIQEMNRSLNNVKLPDMKDGGGGLFSGMGDKMSGALQVFAGNMLTKAAGAVANLGSEIFSSVQQGVELARQGEGIRIAFERLGRGDILDGLREATHGTVTDLELMKAAVKFNDFKLPLDELGTMLAFAQQKAKDTGQSVDYMVDSIVTGLGRKSLMILDNLGLSANEVKEKMKETGDMTKAVGAIIREQMSKAGDYVETAADRATQANVNLQNKMEELGSKFAPLEEASNNFWTSMKIGILDVIGGPLTDLLNKLTQAGRMANAYGLMGGNTKVGRMTSNLAGASEGNRQSIYQQQQEQFWRYINPREQQIKDIRAWQSGDRNEALQKRIGAITEKYGSLDATKIQAEVDAAKKMLSDYQAAAKQILSPVKADIDTKGAEQNVESLKVKLIELEAQRKKAIAAGDTDLSKNLAKQINQVKADIKGLGGTTTTTTTHKATPQETAANKVKDAERIYSETLLKNSIRLEAGMDTTLEYKKRELSAQERLFDAYNDAYATYQDPAYKKASTEAAEKIKTLAGEVKAASDAQEAARKSARELDAAQRKLADAQQKLAEARATGSATAVYKAQQEVDKRQKVVEQVQYVADVKAGKMPTLPENMKAEMVVTANTDEAVRALQDIQGIKIAPKSFTVITDDADAMERLREIDGVSIDDKTFSVSVNDADTLAKVREIAGVTIDDKTMTVTATTDEAVRALQDIQGVMIQPKSFDISTDDAEALAKVNEIDGVTIDTKTFAISTDNEEALAKVREIQDLTIEPKTVKIVQDVSEQGEKSSFGNLVETVQAEIKFDQMKVDETALHTLLQTALQNGLDGLALSYEGIQEKISKGIDIPDETWQALQDEINEKLKALGIDPIEIPIETVGKDVKAITKAASMAADAVGNIGAAFNAIEDPAAKVMGTVLQAIASIALGFAQASASPAVTSTGWGWLAWLGAGTAALATTIATVHSLTGYAQGGIVKGNSYSGDNVPALVDGSQMVGLNAGEVVLTKAMAGNLAQQLQDSESRGQYYPSRVSGEQIYIALNAYTRRTGKGELVTWK